MGPYDIILGNGFSGTEGPIFVGPVGKKAPKSTKSAGKKGREWLLGASPRFYSLSFAHAAFWSFEQLEKKKLPNLQIYYPWW